MIPVIGCKLFWQARIRLPPVVFPKVPRSLRPVFLVAALGTTLLLPERIGALSDLFPI
jgi:hypothetical protein